MPTATPAVLRNKTIAVIGLGQIGGSIVKRLSQARPKITLIAHDRDRRLATKAGRFAEWVTDLGTIVQRSDTIILALPVPSIIALMKEIASTSKSKLRKLLVLDTGTVKHAVHQEAIRHRIQFDYVGLHPLAGTEGEGWDSARCDLFLGKRIVVTPTVGSRIAMVRGMIHVLGAIALPMDPRSHDRLVAEAIGLPHILAFAAQGMSRDNALRAGSWGSLTRVAASNLDMVAGFLSANATEQKRVIANFEIELKKLKRALNDKSGKALLKLLAARQRTE